MCSVVLYLVYLYTLCCTSAMERLVEIDPALMMLHHKDFYYPDGTDHVLVRDVISFHLLRTHGLQVDQTLFKIHRSYLCQVSEAFRDMFMAPIPSGVLEGSSDERPIVLDQIKASEFEMFLSVIFGK